MFLDVDQNLSRAFLLANVIDGLVDVGQGKDLANMGTDQLLLVEGKRVVDYLPVKVWIDVAEFQ